MISSLRAHDRAIWHLRGALIQVASQVRIGVVLGLCVVAGNMMTALQLLPRAGELPAGCAGLSTAIAVSIVFAQPIAAVLPCVLLNFDDQPRYRDITTLVLPATPLTLLARAICSGVTVCLWGSGQAIGAVVMYRFLAPRGIDASTLSATEYRELLLASLPSVGAVLVYLATLCIFCVSICLIFRSRYSSVAVLLTIVAIIAPLVQTLLPEVGKYLPGIAGISILRGDDSGNMLPPGIGLLVLLFSSLLLIGVAALKHWIPLRRGRSRR